MFITPNEIIDIVVMTFAIGYIFSGFIKEPEEDYEPLNYFKKKLEDELATVETELKSVGVEDPRNPGEWQTKETEMDVLCGYYGKGGVFVEFMGIRGVIPKIQLTEEYLNNPADLEGKKIKVKVLEVDREKNRLVVSQKAAALNISQKDLKKRFNKIKIGGKYKTKVLGVSEFGIFCEVEGVEGLIHISELSWEKVSDVSTYAKQGDIIESEVVEKNNIDMKLNLSIKRLSYDPWKDIEKKYKKDKEVDGEIVRKEKYGYFVRLEPGIEGLIHSSKLSGQEEFKIGQKVKAYIERINKRLRRLSLILPQKAKPVTYR